MSPKTEHICRSTGTVLATIGGCVLAVYAWVGATNLNRHLAVEEALLHNSQAAVIAADESGTILLGSQAARDLFGYEKLAGMQITDLMDETTASKHEPAFAEAIQKIRHGTFEPKNVVCRLGMAKRADGSEFRVVVLLNSYTEKSGHIILVATLRSEDEVRTLHDALQ